MSSISRMNTVNQTPMENVQPSNDQLRIVKKAFYSGRMNFAYSFRPIYYCSRIFGLKPFSIIFDSNGQVQEPRVRICDGLWFVISICSYLSLTYVLYQERMHPGVSSLPSILKIGGNIHMILSHVFSAFIVAMDMFNRSKLVDILKMFNTFDDEVSQYTNLTKILKDIVIQFSFSQVAKFEVRFNYKDENRCSWYCCIGTIVASFLLMAISCYVHSYSALSDIVYFCCVFLIRNSLAGLISMSLVFLSRCLHKRFIALNSILRYSFQ